MPWAFATHHYRSSPASLPPNAAARSGLAAAVASTALRHQHQNPSQHARAPVSATTREVAPPRTAAVVAASASAASRTSAFSAPTALPNLYARMPAAGAAAPLLGPPADVLAAGALRPAALHPTIPGAGGMAPRAPLPIALTAQPVALLPGGRARPAPAPEALVVRHSLSTGSGVGALASSVADAAAGVERSSDVAARYGDPKGVPPSRRGDCSAFGDEGAVPNRAQHQPFFVARGTHPVGYAAARTRTASQPAARLPAPAVAEAARAPVRGTAAAAPDGAVAPPLPSHCSFRPPAPAAGAVAPPLR